jgi:probable rRNA maturation factor
MSDTAAFDNHEPDILETSSINIGNLEVDIEIHNIATKAVDGWRPTTPWITILERTLNTALKTELNAEAFENMPHAELSIVLSDDRTVREYNRDYRAKDKATNILSFPGMDEDELEIFLAPPVPSAPMPPLMIGDLILAFETLQRESDEQSKTITDHFTHLIIHGLLHLLGYDHINDDDAHIMEDQERKILSILNIRDPYKINDLETNRG